MKVERSIDEINIFAFVAKIVKSRRKCSNGTCAGISFAKKRELRLLAQSQFSEFFTLY